MINMMKRIYILSILMAGIFLIPSCSEKSVPVKNDEELKKPTMGEEIPGEVATEVFDKAPITNENVPELNDQEEDCHGKRAVGQTLEEVEGIIMKVAGKFVIATDNGNSRYNPCELPKKLSREGVLVRFTGEVLEIFPGERLFATPFRLRNIVERD